MTSHFINYFARKAQSTALLSSPAAPGRAEAFNGIACNKGKAVEGCTFCEILAGEMPAFKVYEDEYVLAFLDILPIREGHILVIPRQHYARVSHLPDDVSAAIGRALPRIARALCRAVDQPDFNIISNQGYAQIVYHVHYHLVPAPHLHSTGYTAPRSGWASIVGRDELDEEEGAALAERIREEVAKEERGEVEGWEGTKGRAKL